MRWRLQFSDFPENSKNPILLPKQSYLPYVVTLVSHFQTKHGGIKKNISQVRSKYWIIYIRQLVKYTIKKCFLCQRFESKPCQYPPSRSRPPCHSQQSLSFKTTSVDYLGPDLVKPIFNGTDSSYF